MKRLMILILALSFAAPLIAQETPAEPTTPPVPDTTPPALTWPESQSFSLFQPGSTLLRIHFGVQPIDIDTESSKFEEYRDTPDGVVLPFLQIASEGSTEFSITAEDVGQADQRYNIGVERGNWGVSLVYDEIPHNLGNDARMLLRRTTHDRYEISDTLQLALQNAIAAQRAQSPASVNFNFLRNLVAPSLAVAERLDIGLVRERGMLEIGYSPGGAEATGGGAGAESAAGPGTPWSHNISLTYFQEDRHGDRQAGTSFGFGNVVETPEPIDYITRDLGVAAELPFGNTLVRGGLHYNDFSNKIEALIFDNPFRAVDSTDPNAYTAPGSGSINGPSRGLVALPPDNKALTGTVGFLSRLPANSRLSGDFALGRWTQNDELFPYTTNTAITTPFDATDPRNLPVNEFDGDINTTTASLAFSTRPMAGLSFNARYRLYDMDNQSERVELPGYVRFDAVWEEIPRITVPYSNTFQRIDFSLGYDVGPLGLEAGYRIDQVERTFRETEETNENVITLAASYRPFTWAAARVSYEFGDRDFDGEYDTEHSEHASYLEPGPPVNLLSLRRYDQAKRDTDRLNLMLQFTPFGSMGVTVSYLGTQEDYNESQHGLIDVDNSAVSLDVDWTPSDRWGLYGFFTAESWTSFMRGRQSGATLSSNPLDDWTADIEDDVSSIGFGGNLAVIPERLDFKLFGRFQEIDGFNDLDSPPGGTPDVAFDIPEFDDTSLWNVAAEFEYRLSPMWRLNLGGWIEDYEIRDAQTSGTTHYMPGGFFLAPNDADYNGNVLYIRASYRR